MRRIFAAALILGLACLLPARADDNKKDQAALKGTWKVTKIVVNGQSPPDAEHAALEITEDQITPKVPNRDEKPAKYTLDASKSPKQIDVTVDNDTMQGIYEIKEDTVKFCLCKKGLRPSSFEATGQDIILIEAKKQK